MATCLKALANDVLRKAKDTEKLTSMEAWLYETISSIDGLTSEEIVNAGSIVTLDIRKIDYLFSISDEFKAICIRYMLARTI